MATCSSVSSYNNNSEKTLEFSKKKKKEFDQLFKTVTSRFLRGFSTGICVHAGYTLVKSILRGSSKQGLVRSWKTILSKPAIKTATFLGLFPSLYLMAFHYVKKLRNLEDDWNYLISGAIAGLSILSLDKDNRQTVTFFSLSRAIGAAIPSLVARGDLPSIPHTDIVVFSIITGIIMYSACLHPDYLSPGYYRSILKWAHDYTDEIGVKLFRTPGPKFLTCQEAGVHVHSCLKHSLLDLKRGIPAVAKIYFPVHALPILIYKRNAMVTSPLSLIKSFVSNMASSTTFLVTMTTVAKVCLCALRNAHHHPPPMSGIIPFVSGTLGAWLGILWERKRRRRELALFNVFQVLGIIYMAFKTSSLGWKYGWGIPQGFTVMFCIATMVIMHAYETQPDYLNSITTAGLKFLVGARHVDMMNCKEHKVALHRGAK